MIFIVFSVFTLPVKLCVCHCSIKNHLLIYLQCTIVTDGQTDKVANWPQHIPRSHIIARQKIKATNLDNDDNGAVSTDYSPQTTSETKINLEYQDHREQKKG